MKKLWLFLILSPFIFALPVWGDSADDDAERKAMREQLKLREGREAMREKREEFQILSAEELARAAAEERRKENEREKYLIQNFETMALLEVAKARRLYDLKTVGVLETEAKARYGKESTRPFNQLALATIYLFNCEYQLYRYNTTPYMYERPRILKERAEEALKGLALVDKLLATAPNNPEYWRMKGIFLACQPEKKFSKKRHWPEAEAALKKAIALSDDPLEAKLSLASFYFHRPKKAGRNIEAAVALAREVLTINPSSVEAYLLVGRAEHEKYRYAEALNEYKKAMKFEPENPEVEYYYAMGRKDKKRFKKLMASP